MLRMSPLPQSLKLFTTTQSTGKLYSVDMAHYIVLPSIHPIFFYRIGCEFTVLTYALLCKTYMHYATSMNGSGLPRV